MDDYSEQIKVLNTKIKAIKLKLENYENDFLVLRTLQDLVAYAQAQAECAKELLSEFYENINKYEITASDYLSEIPGALDIVLFTGKEDNKKNFDTCVGNTENFISNNSKTGLLDLGQKLDECLEDLGHQVSSLEESLNDLEMEKNYLQWSEETRGVYD